MRRPCFKKSGKTVELLELKANRLAYDVQERLDFYDISLQVDIEQMETILNDVIKVELEEVKEVPEATKGKVTIWKGKFGKYYSVKNIYFRLSDFLDYGFSLTQANEISSMLIVSAILLWKLVERLGFDLKEEQTAVCVALYRLTKRYAITDDNITEHVDLELQESGYGELDRRAIGKALSGLMEVGILSIEEGRYEVAQKIVFK